MKTSAPQAWINSALVVIVVCYISRLAMARYGEEGRLGGISEMGAAVLN